MDATRRGRVGLLVTGGVLAVTALGACTHEQAGSSGGIAAQHGAMQAAPARGSAPAGAAASAPRGADTADVGKLALAPAKIRTAQLTVAVRHGDQVAAKADQAGAIATAAGGEVDADDRSAEGRPTATLVLKVPPASLDRVLHELSALGTEKSRSLSTRDVTAKVADVSSRVASARQAIDRLRVLYKQAVKVSNVIAVENELAGREADLESLEAQQRALTGETSMATVTLALRTASHHATAPPATKTHGFVGGLIAGWHAFLDGAGWLATALGAVLPFAAVLLALALLGRLAWRRTGRRAPAEPPAA